MSSEDEICRGPVDGLVEAGIGVQVRSEEVLNDGGIIGEGVLCHAALSVKTNVSSRAQHFIVTWSCEALEPQCTCYACED